MNTIRPAAFLLLCAATLPAFAGPAKPGLWETRTTSDGETETDQHCIKANDNSFEQWRGQINKGCTVTTLKNTATAQAYDYNCVSPTQNGKGHLAMTFTSPTQYRAKMQFDGKLIAGGKSIPLNMKMEQEGKWVSADCGDVGSDTE